MSRRLRSTVYLTGEDGSTACLLAGSVPTAAHAALITNPKAWEEGEAAPPTSPISPQGGIVPPEVVGGSEGREAFVPTLDQPPRKGPGSSRAAWLNYAHLLGLMPDEYTHLDRDGIIRLLDARKG